ncbi:MAG: hypothetical protein WC926_04240 [Candidatus Paceibacterota bacterium]|jgi:hypothetical protein
MDTGSMNAVEVLKKLDSLVFPGNPCQIVAGGREFPSMMDFINFFDTPNESASYLVERSCASGKIMRESYYLKGTPGNPISVAAGLVRDRYREMYLAKRDSRYYKKFGSYEVGGYSDIIKKIDILLGKILKPEGVSWKDLFLSKISNRSLDTICIRQIIEKNNLSVEESAELIQVKGIVGYLEKRRQLAA